ncbi:hypothetical protein GCM10029978_010250 [Actinoallomurus acanthiterrae]
MSSHSSEFFPDLSAYGWDEERERSFASYRAKGLVPARIVGVDRGRCDVVTENGPLQAGTSLVRSPDPVALPCTGDWAAVRPGRDPQITDLLPRRGVIVRAAVSRSSHGQALAANVDVAAVVVSAAAEIKPGRVERLLTLAWESGATPVIVLTKVDESPDLPSLVAETRQAAPGVEVVATSAVTGEGIEALQAVLTGTVVLLGPSGAGKSTLGNALLGTAILETGAVRAQDGKGRTRRCAASWSRCRTAPCSSTLRACAASACTTRRRGCGGRSPTSRSSLRSAASPTAAMSPSPVVRSWPRSPTAR